jgi:hypothetical protein
VATEAVEAVRWIGRDAGEEAAVLVIREVWIDEGELEDRHR